jgi:hypothetical protein
MKKLLVLTLALVMVAFTIPAMAAEAPGPSIVLGARVNQTIGWQNRSEELTANGTDDITSSFVELPGNSYWRAKFTSADKKVGVHVEIGLKSSVGMRHVYGWYKMGNCKLLAGNTDNWHGAVYWNYHKLNAAPGGDLLGWGKLWAPRRPQVQLTWEKDNFGVQVALEKAANVNTVYGASNYLPFFGYPANTTFADVGVDVYQTVPRLSLSMQYKTGGFSTTPSFGYAKYDTEGVPQGIEDNFEAWAFILPVKVVSGAFTVQGELHYAKNPGVGYSGYPGESGLSLYSFKSFSSYEDTTNWGGYIDASYSFGALRVAVGFGYEYFENDAWKETWGFKEDNFNRKLFYISLPYKMHKNLTLYPEFNYLDHGENWMNGEDNGNEWVLGVLFRFVF